MTYDGIVTEEELQGIRRALERIADVLEERQRPLIVNYDGKIDDNTAQRLKDAIAEWKHGFGSRWDS